jgi:hypothetical protein
MATIALNDKIFTQVALQAFVAKLAPLNAFVRDFSSQTARKGDAVIVPLISSVTATTFNNSYEEGGGDIKFATINVNRHRIASVDLTDIQVANSSAAVLDNLAIQAGEGLAKQVLLDIFSVVTTTNFGAAVLTTAGASYKIAQIGALRKALAARDVPTDRLSFIGDIEIYNGLLTSDGVAQALNYGGTEAVREGRIPRLLGMDVYESNVMPANGLTKLGGFAVHPDSIAIAMRYLQPQAPQEYLSAEQVSASNGISMGYRRHYNTATGKHFANFECLFGFTPALTLGLALVTVPA